MRGWDVVVPPLFLCPRAPEFPRIVFAGNSSQCIKTAANEGRDYYHSLPVPILGRFLCFTLRDRHSRHLGLLPLVTHVEYSCTTLHN